jgi:hypothetical protein
MSRLRTSLNYFFGSICLGKLTSNRSHPAVSLFPGRIHKQMPLGGSGQEEIWTQWERLMDKHPQMAGWGGGDANIFSRQMFNSRQCLPNSTRAFSGLGEALSNLVCMTWHLWPELIRGRKTPG